MVQQLGVLVLVSTLGAGAVTPAHARGRGHVHERESYCVPGLGLFDGKDRRGLHENLVLALQTSWVVKNVRVSAMCVPGRVCEWVLRGPSACAAVPVRVPAHQPCCRCTVIWAQLVGMRSGASLPGSP